VNRRRDAEYTEYVTARLSPLQRLASVLRDDRQRAVQRYFLTGQPE
jgi:hypothetical protein